MLQIMEAAMPFTAMIMVESTDVIISTLSKAAMAEGMNNLAFLVYSNALATFLLLPFLLLSSRNNVGAPLSFSMILAFFLLGLIGSVGQILAYTGKGPVYVAMFKPLGMVIAVAFLRESLHLGSVIGSVVIGCGHYTVIWGQIKLG